MHRIYRQHTAIEVAVDDGWMTNEILARLTFLPLALSLHAATQQHSLEEQLIN